MTLDQIAEATLALGLDQATVRTVAEALGMSTPGLYHYVRIREDLVDIAAAYTLRLQPLPDPKNNTWRSWLAIHARQIYDTLVTQPAFLSYMISGPAYASARLQQLEQVLEILTGFGFGLEEANVAYVQVISAASGAASYVARDRAVEAAGHTHHTELKQAASELGEGALPLVRRLFSTPIPRGAAVFESVLNALLDGIALQRGESLGP